MINIPAILFGAVFFAGMWIFIKDVFIRELGLKSLLGLGTLLMFVGILGNFQAHRYKYRKNSISVSPVAVAETYHLAYAEAQDNGTPGGFTLLRVTAKQWEFLNERGLQVHHSGNVLDTVWPKDFGPILMAEGFWVTLQSGKKGWLPDSEKRPDIFWVAVRTDADTYATPESSSE